MELSESEITKIAQAGRQRVLESHTAAHRASELESIFETARNVPVENFYHRQMVAEV